MAIATIIAITGQAWARDADGNLRELRIGDTLQEGETLVTSDNGRVELDFGDGLDPTVVGAGQEIAMTPDLDADQPVAAEEASVQDDDLDALLTAIDEGEGDLLEDLEATAAGAGGGGGADGGHDFVSLVRIVEATDPLAFEFSTSSLDSVEFDEAEPETLESAVSGVVNFQLFSGDANVDGESVVEGNDFTLVATLDTPPVDAPLVINLSNGQQIIIPVGETSGEVVLDSREDDFFVFLAVGRTQFLVASVTPLVYFNSLRVIVDPHCFRPIGRNRIHKRGRTRRNGGFPQRVCGACFVNGNSVWVIGRNGDHELLSDEKDSPTVIG